MQRDLAKGVYLYSEAPSPHRFLLGMVKKFCRFVIWSKTLQCLTPIYALHSTRSPTPPPRYTLYKYRDMYLFTQGRGEGVRLTSEIFYKRDRKYQHG
jgi:hypothetical protein